MNKLLFVESRRIKAIIILLTVGAATPANIFLYPHLGIVAHVVMMLPSIAAAWYFGALAGTIMMFVGLLVNFLAGGLIPSLNWQEYPLGANLLGSAAVWLTSLLVARLGKLTRQIRQELAVQKGIEAERRARADFLTLLNDIVRTALEADNMLSMLATLASRMSLLFNAYDCRIALWDEKTRKLVPMIPHGSLSETQSTAKQFIKVELDFMSTMLTAGKTTAIKDVKRSSYLTHDKAHDHPGFSLLGLPLKANNRKLGAVILGFDGPRDFSDEQIERAELAAKQISLAITKTVLLEEAQQRVRELAGLHSLSLAFSLHGDARGTYGLLTETLADLMNAEMCVITLQDKTTHELFAQVPAYGLEDALVPAFHYRAGQGAAVWSFSKNGVFRANSVSEIPAEFLALARSFNVANIMAAPLWEEEKKILGAIVIANKPGGFNDNDVHLLELFASQVVVVIQNIILLGTERTRAGQLSVLHAVATAATEADNEDQLIERVTRIIGERLYPDSFGILMLDEDGKELYLHQSYRLGPHEGPMRIPLGIGITGMVARSGKPHLVDDVTFSPEYLSLYPLTRSALCVPLKVEEKLLGVVNAESKSIGVFNQDDEGLLTIIAGQLATAIQRLRVAGAEHYQTAQLERSNSLIRALAQVNAKAAAAVDPDGVMQTLGNELTKLGLRCAVALLNLEGQQAAIRYVSLSERLVRAIERFNHVSVYDYEIPIERLTIFADSNLTACLVDDPLSLIKNLVPDFSQRNATKILRLMGITQTTAVCQLPLIVEGRLVGILWMWGEGLHQSDLPTMSLFASQVAAALQNAGLLTEVRRLAITDELTGIYNRRHFFELAETAFARAQKKKHTLSALILDLDHFKQFNDRYGHVVGDQVLRDAARRLQSAMRESDVVGRYGGEEFSVILPDTNVETAVRVAERIMAQVTSTPIVTEAGDLTVHLSIGVAGMSEETPTLHALINRADQAMYMAKNAGRNGLAVK